MPNPNTDFSAGATLLASQQNRLPRGVMARAVSPTSYTLTTTETVATDMTVTFTAVADRYYRVTYYEPQAQTGSTLSSTTATIRLTDAAGTIQSSTVFQNETSAQDQQGMTCLAVTTFTAGSVTLVGCAKCTTTTGTPAMVRSANANAILLVEDIGPI
jgi:hypothetical protein